MSPPSPRNSRTSSIVLSSKRKATTKRNRLTKSNENSMQRSANMFENRNVGNDTRKLKQILRVSRPRSSPLSNVLGPCKIPPRFAAAIHPIPPCTILQNCRRCGPSTRVISMPFCPSTRIRTTTTHRSRAIIAGQRATRRQ
jgi:hypothetical protein